MIRSRIVTPFIEAIMLSFFVTIVPAAFAQEATPEELTERANTWISERIRKLGKPEIAEKVSVDLLIANEFNDQEKWMTGILFEIVIDGLKDRKYTYGSVGIGNSRASARRIAVEEWLAAFGVAFCDSIADSGSFIQLNGMVAYPGLISVRGQLPGKGLPSIGISTKEMLNSIEAVLPALSENGIVTIDLKITVSPNGYVDGECRCNGKIAPALLGRLLTLNWLSGEQPYMLKQYFIVRLNH